MGKIARTFLIVFTVCGLFNIFTTFGANPDKRTKQNNFIFHFPCSRGDHLT